MARFLRRNATGRMSGPLLDLFQPPSARHQRGSLMLPPLRSSSGSTSSYQNQSSLNGSGPSVSEAAYKVHFADWKGDSNSSSAGKLNVLLLAGRERIADHLAMLADAVGRAIDLPRRENEGNSDYVIRLAEALSKMTPRQRADVERQLNLVVQGLKLRFLFEAFGNPTGPQAARIVAYLETARYKDRDPVARSVVTSYRQNGGPDAGSAEHAPAATPPGEAAATPAAQAAGKPQAVQTTPQAAAAPAPMTADGAEIAKIRALSGGAEAPDTALSAPEFSEPETDNGIDARSLQTLLRRAFEGGESGDSTIEAKATAELLAASEEHVAAEIADGIEALIEEPAEFDLDPRFQPQSSAERPAQSQSRPLPRTEMHEAPTPRPADTIPAQERAIGRGRDTAALSLRATGLLTPASHPHEDYQPTLFTLKGWTEADFDARDLTTAYDIIAEDGEEAQAMLAAGAGAEEMAAPEKIDTEPAIDLPEPTLDDTDPIYDPRSAAGPGGEAAEENIPARLPPAPEKSLAESVAKAVPVAVERQVLAQLQPTGRETPLFAIAPFSPLADVLSYEDEKEAEERRFHDDEAEGDDAASDQSGEDEDGADGEERPRPSFAEFAVEDEGDRSERAYGLYQRMAGWA